MDIKSVILVIYQKHFFQFNQVQKFLLKLLKTYFEQKITLLVDLILDIIEIKIDS